MFRDFRAAENKVRTLREAGFTGPIHVSINGVLGSNFEDWEKQPLKFDQKTSLTVHDENLGLYGNFRYLASECKTKFFAWVALDDCPPMRLISELLAGDPQDWSADLYYSHHALVETIFPTLEDCSGLGHDELVCPIDTAQPFSPDPSAIFGVWNTHWLQSNFPAQDFDWLDTYLLSKVVISGRISLQGGIRGIGVQMGRTPHSVNGKFHSPMGWAIRTILLAARTFQFWKWLRAFAGRIRASVQMACSFYVAKLKG